MALGLSIQLQQPVVLICTSGTAALNFAPAVAEAFYQNVPLLVLTADRPKEWIGQNDGQAIEQENIFEKNVLKSYSIQVTDTHPDSDWHIQRIINEAIFISKKAISGPIHINFGFREPFYPKIDEIPNHEVKIIKTLNTKVILCDNEINEIKSICQNNSKILIIIGQSNVSKKNIDLIQKFTSSNQIPVFADINSNFQSISTAILYNDIVVSNLSENEKESLKPDILITFGNQIVSKNIKLFIKTHNPKYHFHIQETNQIIDTFQSITHFIPVSISEFISNVDFKYNFENNYLQEWKKRDKIGQTSIDDFYKIKPFSELGIVKKITEHIPTNSVFHTANSLSVRYLNILSCSKTFNYCNRGTSGIDGCTSTAVGAALATEAMVVLLTGDVAFFYDRNAFWHNYMPKNLRIILLNNSGGFIFKNVEGAKHQPELDSFFVGNHTSTALHLATEFKIDYRCIKANDIEDNILDSFFENSENSKILEIKTDGNEITEDFKVLKQIMQKNSENVI